MSNCPKCGLVIQHGAYSSTVPACKCVWYDGYTHLPDSTKTVIEGLTQRIAELEAKLAAIEAQEPVCNVSLHPMAKGDWTQKHLIQVTEDGMPVFAAPPLRELTDEDIERIHDDGNLSWFDFARAIERFLKGDE